VACEAVFSAESTDLSALHALFYAHSGSDLDTLLSRGPGRPAGPHRSADPIASPRRWPNELGDRVRLDTPVRRIEHGRRRRPGRDDVGGEVVEGAAVIVTLPPTLAGRLEYSPALPSWRDQLTQRLPAGSVIKLYASIRSRSGGPTASTVRRPRTRAREGHLRQLAALGHARHPRRVHGGQRRPHLGPPSRWPSAARPPSTASCATSARRPPIRWSTSSGTGWPRSTAGVATARTSRPACGPRSATRCASRSATIHWAGAECSAGVERLHGGRGPLRRVGRRRGRAAVIGPYRTSKGAAQHLGRNI
jgi:hypothetical protein